MVIKEQKPLTMSEVVAAVGDSEKAMEIKRFIKNFKILDLEKGKAMKDELKALDLIKLKDMYIVKIIDFIPKDASELNKVLIDVSLDQNEIDKILDITRKY